mgnify:CR=1 FL=1
MTENRLYAIVGAHPAELDAAMLGSLGPAFLQKEGYDVIVTRSIEETRAAMAERSIDYVVMELNQGTPKSIDVSAALDVYRAMKPRIDSGEAVFLGVSGHTDVLDAAKLAEPNIVTGLKPTCLRDISRLASEVRERKASKIMS